MILPKATPFLPIAEFFDPVAPIANWIALFTFGLNRGRSEQINDTLTSSAKSSP